MTEDLRQIIRTLLIEELAAQGVNMPARSNPKVREEAVAIRSDQDLAKFVSRLLDITRDNRVRADIESGQHVFRLSHDFRTRPSSHSRKGTSPSVTGGTVEIRNGLVTEKQIHNLPDDITVVKVGKGVQVTPLASDAIYQAGINIERVKT